MSDFYDLRLGSMLRALNLKINEIQREVSGLRQDMKKLTRLMEAQQTSSTAEPEDIQSSDIRDSNS